MRIFIKITTILLFLFVEQISAKSLYVARRSEPYLIVYKIIGNSLEFQKQIVLSGYGVGPIDVEIDDEADILFITYEYSNHLDLFSAKSLQFLDTIVLTDMSNPTDLLYDQNLSRLYITDRTIDSIYFYDWNANQLTLTPSEGSPATLTGLTYNPCGLAINDDILYISDYNYPNTATQFVHLYDIANDFSHTGTIDMGNATVALNYNTLNNVLYGSLYNYSGSVHNLIKHIFSPVANATRDIGAGTIGITSDNDTGLVYLTTYRYGGGYNGAVEVWNTNDANPANWTHTDYFSSGDATLSGLAGLCIGGPYISDAMILTKTAAIENNAGCVDPTDEDHNEITYTITYDPNGFSYTNVSIVDYLPEEVDYEDALTDPCYNIVLHTYTWPLGNLGPDDSGSVQLTVYSNEKAKPGGVITNGCEMTGDFAYSQAICETSVCCWNTNATLFVDDTATGMDNGASWSDAYNDLRDALNEADARSTKPAAIWIAEGAYCPGDSTSDTFQLVPSVDLIGGLAGDEDPCSFELDDRNLYFIHSILTGNNLCNNVVTAGSSITNTTVLDGLVICDAVQDGLNSSASPQIRRCVIRNNARYGLYLTGDGKTPAVENCNVYDNSNTGIYGYYCTPSVKNCWIHHNGEDASDYGANLSNASQPLLRNCTIAYNSGYAVSCSTILRNCILWGNNGGNLQTYCSAKYCCIDPVGSPGGPVPDNNHNLSCLPGFAYNGEEYDDSLYDFHLSDDSPCIDKGDPNNAWYSGETDIDNADRIDGTYVDMGDDESDCEDVSRPRDLNADGAINLHEFALFADAWGTSDPTFNYDETGTVDIDDFALFLDDTETEGYWLWQACWRSTGGIGYMMAGGGESMAMSFAEPLLAQSLSAEPATPSIEEQIEQLYDVIDWMTDFWDLISDELELNDITEEQWFNSIDQLYTMIDELEEYNNVDDEW